VASATFCGAAGLVGVITDAAAPASVCDGLVDMGVVVIKPPPGEAPPVPFLPDISQRDARRD
jgi:hypothetical protein